MFIRNIKSFNYAIGNGYHTDMSGPEEHLNYNWVLIQEVQDFIKQWNADPKNEKMVEVKADYLAERSIQDNIVLESSQNASIVVISYVLMFLYVSIAIGFFPNIIHMKFGLGLIGILVVIFSLFSGIGLTFYWN